MKLLDKAGNVLFMHRQDAVLPTLKDFFGCPGTIKSTISVILAGQQVVTDLGHIRIWQVQL